MAFGVGEGRPVKNWPLSPQIGCDTMSIFKLTTLRFAEYPELHLIVLCTLA